MKRIPLSATGRTKTPCAALVSLLPFEKVKSNRQKRNAPGHDKTPIPGHKSVAKVVEWRNKLVDVRDSERGHQARQVVLGVRVFQPVFQAGKLRVRKELPHRADGGDKADH